MAAIIRATSTPSSVSSSSSRSSTSSTSPTSHCLPPPESSAWPSASAHRASSRTCSTASLSLSKTSTT
jgi:hypothetical protein